MLRKVLQLLPGVLLAVLVVLVLRWFPSCEPTQVLAAPTPTIDERPEKSVLVNRVTVLFFCADWCPACKKAEPQVAKLSKSVNVVKVNYDEHRKVLVEAYGIRRLPTFVVLKDGEEIHRETSVIGLITFLRVVLKLVLIL